MKILLIEDDTIQMVSLKLKIKRLGFDDILVATNGIEALDIIKNNAIDLVFCDLRMPEMDGVTFLAQLAECNCGMSVVILSAADESVLQLIYNMCSLSNFKFVEVIKKPYKQDDLDNVFEKLALVDEHSVDPSQQEELTADELAAGFEYGLFTNHYQPQFHFQTGEMVGVEALVRFEHPLHGVIGPHRFLNVIERLGYSQNLFYVVLKNAVAAISSMDTELQLSVNIAKSNLESKICEDVFAICEQYDFPLHKLTLELTEHDVYNGSITSLANLARLRMNGVGLSIDDFGTGYSSLEQLAQLPYTELKIDKSFIYELSTNYKNQQITHSCLILANSLGLTCVVEGVEDEETWEYLRHHGGDICQGFYTGSPMTADALLELYYKNTNKKVEADNLFDGLHCLILDNQSVSGKALKKLLLKNYHVFSAKCEMVTRKSIEVVNGHLINAIIINQHDVSAETVALCLEARTLGFKGEFIFLADYNAQCPEFISAQLTEYRWLVKEKTLNETASKIVNAILHGENRYAIDSTVQEKLSKRERFVADCLIKGLSNKQIANELDISQKTVSTYKTRVLTKCGVKSIIELLKFNKIE
ncbi:EAL domain-containing protein [Photobacterium japonica]|uniref:EAL domain-containing protein n=1 Tax=Photobacterium japonica TaxID=2910235 RepID=UPI003D145F98